MTEDDWDSTEQGRAVNNFIKYTMSLTMVWAGATLGQLLPRGLKWLWDSVLEKPDQWRNLGAKQEVLQSLAEQAKYLKMLDPRHDEAVRHSVVVIGACSAIEGCIEDLAKAIIRGSPSILDGTEFSADQIKHRYSLTVPEEVLEKQWRRIENTADRDLSFCERFESKLAVIGRAGMVPPLVQQKFDTAYAIRNVWAHNAGYADPNFVTMAPELNFAIGQLVALTDKEHSSSRYLSAVMAYGMIVANRERGIHGLGPTPMHGKPGETDIGKAYNSLYA
jgi:hypothetical protein